MNRYSIILFWTIGTVLWGLSASLTWAEELRSELAEVQVPPAELSNFQANSVNPDTPAATIVSVRASFQAALEDGSLTRITSALLDGQIVELTGKDDNPDDWLWLNEFAKRGPVALVLNRLLLDRAELGLSRADVLAAIDLFDDTDEVFWTNLGGQWIADARLTDDARLLAVFEDGVPVQIAVLSSYRFSRALEYRLARDFAHCGQQALLDAGFDPNGVDGAPGAGARRALVEWSMANDITMPAFTRENASQICYVLTASQPYHADLKRGTMTGYPGAAWNGWTSSTALGFEATVRYEGNRIRQVERLNFGPGIVYRFDGQDGNGNQINQELQSPWPIVGTVITHGNDTPRPAILAALMQNDSVGAARAVVDGQAGGYNGLMDDLYNRPDDIDALWSIIGNLDGAEILVLDAVPTRNDPATGRVVIIFSDNGNGSGQLLYAWHNRVIPGSVDISPIE